MKNFFLCFFMFLISHFVFYISANAQSLSEINLMKRVPIYQPKKKIEYPAAKNNTNEIQLLFSGLFLFYKNFISSQDGSSCAFTPSCSEYGMIAVKKQGVIIGVINTFDRLTRCNGFNPDKYPIHSETHLFYDPVE